MKIIDKRTIPFTVTFGDLGIGEAFQDHEGDMHIKTELGMSIYWDKRLHMWQAYHSMREDDLVIPLEVTYTFERSEGNG